MKVAIIYTWFDRNLTGDYTKTRFIKILPQGKRDYLILNSEKFTEEMIKEIETNYWTVFNTVEEFGIRKSSKL